VKLLSRFKNWFTRKQSIHPLQEIKTEPDIILQPWWGTYGFIEGQFHQWQVGNLSIGAKRKFNEWQIASWATFNPQLQDLPLSNELLSFKQINYRTTQDTVAVKPIAADKQTNSKLMHPIHIPGHTEVLLFVLSPIWVELTTLSPEILLQEFSTSPLTDSWLGLNTLEGELCYASFTACSTTLDDLNASNHYLITPIAVKNQSKLTLILDKIILPAPYLAVYTDKYHRLWTEKLLMKWEGVDLPYSKIMKGPPHLLQEPQLLSPARLELSSTSGFKSLLHNLIGK